MKAKEAIAFVRKHGVVLGSANGPVPKLTEAIAGEQIKGSWWAHPKSNQIFRVLQAVTDSDEVLVCRLVNGKITFVHRRLWPALVRVANQFPSSRTAQLHEEHTESGRHITREVPFPEWVPADVLEEAKKISDAQALEAFGAWLPQIRSS